MKKLSIAIISGLFSLTAFSQDLLQCVNPDVINSLIFNGRSESKFIVTRDVPDELSDFDAPSDFEFVGSMERNDSLSTVAYKTGLDGEEAFDAALASLEANGWELEAEPSFIVSVFNLTSGPLAGTVCRDGDRRSLNVREVSGARFVSLNFIPPDRPRACHAEDPRMSGIGMRGLVHEAMPTLYFPDSSRAANGGNLASGISGAGESTRTSVQVQSPDTSAALIDHLGTQMADQGWLPDSGWTGQTSTGTTWSRQTDDNLRYTGVLEAVSLGDSVYDVRLRLRLLD